MGKKIYVRKFDVSIEKKKSVEKIIIGFLFSHVGLLFMSVGYAILGAYIFIQLELPNEEESRLAKQNKTLDVDEAVSYLKGIFWTYANNERYNYSREEYHDAVSRDLITMKEFVVDYYTNYGYDTTNDWTYSWTFSKALLFTFTIMTTIGYGHIVPKTEEGKLFCIVYALIGIPLLLVFMANIGDLMASTIKWIYSRVCCFWCRGGRKKSLKAYDEDFDEENFNYMTPTKYVKVPVMISILLIIAFMYMGAFAFSDWENWPMPTAFYFCFITLATIGFGDKVPVNSFLHYNEGTIQFLKMVFTLAYIIVGIALIAMCIQLMQEQVMYQAAKFSESIGLSNKSSKKLSQERARRDEREELELNAAKNEELI